MNYKIFIFCIFICSSFQGQAQQLKAVASLWNDSFKEWVVYTDQEDVEGYLRLRWSDGRDWTQWDYRIGEYTGSIQTKWPNRLDEWECRGDNEIISARTLWRNDVSEWRISGAALNYKWQSRYSNILEEWVIDTEDNGFFEMYTAYEGDIRDWTIVDELNAPLCERMMLVFLSIINTVPHQ